ncbi:MAG: type IV pilus assembly protein PilM [Patescibacteria group bacterium]
MSLLKKLSLPDFSLKSIFGGRSGRVAGIDIGSYSAKVVQLRNEGGRAILETYGELETKGYFQKDEASGRNTFLFLSDNEISTLIADLVKESGVAADSAVFGIPLATSFITTFPFPRLSVKEIEQALPYEARKYVPIPLSEVILDWDVFESPDVPDQVTVLLAAVPVQVVEKIKRIAEMAGIAVRAFEVESFSAIRAIAGEEDPVTAIIDMGHRSTSVIVAEKAVLRMSRNITQGGQHITRALERGLGVSEERAEAIKREVGLSDKAEEREIASIITPFFSALATEISRLVAIYNRKSSAKVQKIVLTGGASNLKGAVDYVAANLALEVTRAHPFSRVVAPAFIMPMLREIGPNLATATGLALHEMKRR